MNKWETPKVLIDKFVPNQYVAACAGLVILSDPDNIIYLDFRHGGPNGSFDEGENATISSSGLVTISRPEPGSQTYSNIYVYHDRPYNSGNRIGLYNLYVYQPGRDTSYAYLYQPGYLPDETPTPEHNFNS